MKRLAYILWACPLATALQTVPMLCCHPLYRLLAAMALALGLWAVVWVRLYANRRLRPEFAVLAVLPQLWFYGLGYAGDAAAALTTPFWQNLYFFAWCATAFVGVRALLLGPSDDKPGGRVDSVLVFMSIITAAFCLSSWLDGASYLSLNN